MFTFIRVQIRWKMTLTRPLKVDMKQSIMSNYLNSRKSQISFKKIASPWFLGPWPTIVDIDQQWRHQTLRKWLLRNKDKIISDFETYHWVPGQFSTFFLFLAFYSTMLLFLVRVDLNFYHIFHLFSRLENATSIEVLKLAKFRCTFPSFSLIYCLTSSLFNQAVKTLL